MKHWLITSFLISGGFLVSCGARTGADDFLAGGAGIPVRSTGGGFSTGGSLIGPGDCCLPGDGASCIDDAVAECVCAADAFCCDNRWDESCVSYAAEACNACSATGGSGGGTGGSGGTGGFLSTGGSGGFLPTGGSGGTGGFLSVASCCFQSDTPGCQDGFGDVSDVEACVCAADAFCCESNWDAVCIQEVESFGCGVCDGGVGGSGGTGGATGGTGGTGGATGGTGGATGGTGGATGGTGGTGGATGGTGGSSGECCAGHAGLGCEDDAISQCVCAEDAFCCDVQWDDLCVQEVEAFGCGVCDGGVGGSGGTGGTGGGSGGFGAGGSQQCQAAFPGACAGCLCEDCYDGLTECLSDFGCVAIFNCVATSGCDGFECLQPDACGDLIDQTGGFFGPSAQSALNLTSCGIAGGCPCQ